MDEQDELGALFARNLPTRVSTERENHEICGRYGLCVQGKRAA